VNPTAGWNALVALAAFLVAAATEFVELPPGDGQARALAIFCVAALVAIGYVGLRRWNAQKHLLAWCLATLIGLASVLAVHYYYSTQFSRYVASYEGSKYVIGDVLTDLGRSYRDKNPQKSDEEILFDSGGKVTQIWTAESVAAARTRLRYWFVACSPLVGFTIVCAAQVYRLANQRRRARRQARRQ